MSSSVGLVAALVLVFGFLSGSTFYFYNKSRTLEQRGENRSSGFQADLTPLEATPSPQPVDTLTTPGEPKNKLSYPAHVYKMPPRQSLASTGDKMQVPWQLIRAANGIQNENVVQADYPMMIPKKNVLTGYYRIEFLINNDKLAELTRETRSVDKSEWFDPINVAKRQAVPYFGLAADNAYSLLEQNDSRATAAVTVKQDEVTILIGLVQPGEKGSRGVWALYYVEWQK